MRTLEQQLLALIDLPDYSISKITYIDGYVLIKSTEFLDICKIDIVQTAPYPEVLRFERTHAEEYHMDSIGGYLVVLDHNIVYKVPVDTNAFDLLGDGQIIKIHTTDQISMPDIGHPGYKIVGNGPMQVVYGPSSFYVLRGFDLIYEYPECGEEIAVGVNDNYVVLLTETGQLMLLNLETLEMKSCEELNICHIDLCQSKSEQETILKVSGDNVLVVSAQRLYEYHITDGTIILSVELENTLLEHEIIVKDAGFRVFYDGRGDEARACHLLHLLFLDETGDTTDEFIMPLEATNFSVHCLARLENAISIGSMVLADSARLGGVSHILLGHCSLDSDGSLLVVVECNGNSTLFVYQLAIVLTEDCQQNQDYLFGLTFSNCIQLDFRADLPEPGVPSAQHNQYGTINEHNNEIVQFNKIMLKQDHPLNMRHDKIVCKARKLFEKKKADRKVNKPTMFHAEEYVKPAVESRLVLCDKIRNRLYKEHCKISQGMKNDEARLHAEALARKVNAAPHKTQEYIQASKYKRTQLLHSDEQVINVQNVNNGLFLAETSQNSIQIYQKHDSGVKFVTQFSSKQLAKSYSCDQYGEFMAISTNQGFELYEISTKEPVLKPFLFTNEKFDQKVAKHYEPTILSFINSEYNYISANTLKQQYNERLIVSNLLNQLNISYFAYAPEDPYKQFMVTNHYTHVFQNNIQHGKAFRNCFSANIFLQFQDTMVVYDIVRDRQAYEFNCQYKELVLPDFQYCGQKYFAGWRSVGQKSTIDFFDLRVSSPIESFQLSGNTKGAAFLDQGNILAANDFGVDAIEVETGQCDKVVHFVGRETTGAICGYQTGFLVAGDEGVGVYE